MTAHIHRVVYLEESVLGVLVLAGNDGHLRHPRLTHRQALDVLDVVHLVRFLIIYIQVSVKTNGNLCLPGLAVDTCTVVEHGRWLSMLNPLHKYNQSVNNSSRTRI